MSESAKLTYYMRDTFYDAEGLVYRIIKPVRDELAWEYREPDQSTMPSWMREPVWVIEISVKRLGGK